ncbi:MAG: pyridoxal phosphate-dependent aminotransferase [Spirochaetaceae bacterium]|nr:MAG: pyridoxal phosphate-dependent aminotransferase [Spirochaetaceae bacterium]
MHDSQVFDFDLAVERRGTHSVKWDSVAAGDLPMWVADMDFAAPPTVIGALAERVRHGVFGYPYHGSGYLEAVVAWEATRHGRSLDPSAYIDAPSVLAGVRSAIRCLSEPGDGIVIQPPVYPPFFSVIQGLGRVVRENRLVRRDGRYEMDLAGFEELAREPRTRALLLCSPHNPVGRVWSEAELLSLAEICQANDITVISDEIHASLIMPGTTFRSFDSLGDSIARRCVTCISPSKTFNIAGLLSSHVVASDDDIRNAMKSDLAVNCGHVGNVLALIAAETAYRTGHAWLDALMEYLSRNYAFLADFLTRNAPAVGVTQLEGTYLAWLDLSGAVETPEDAPRLLRRRHKLVVSPGADFGDANFIRVNFGCPRATLQEGLEKILDLLR